MRRVMLLALLALALPTAALASSTITTYTTGDFLDGLCTGPAGITCASAVANPGGFAPFIQGSLHDITFVLFLSPLSHCPDHVAGTCFDILPGTFPRQSLVSVHPHNSGVQIFADYLSGGIVIEDKDRDAFRIRASLLPGPQVPGLISGRATAAFTFNGATITDGTGKVRFTGTLREVPEPGTLGLLGTGLIGLAGLARRKLKLWV